MTTYTLHQRVDNAHGKCVSSVKYSNDGNFLVSSSADRTLKIWDALSMKELQCFKGHDLAVSDVAWSWDCSRIISASDDTTLRVWDAYEGRESQQLRGHLSHVLCTNFSHDRNIVISGSFDQSVRLWDLRSGASFRTIAAHSEPVTSVSYSKDGTMICTSSYDGLARLWDPGSAQCLTTLTSPGHPPISSAHFTPNGRYVLATAWDNTIRLFDTVSGVRLKTYRGHENTSVNCPTVISTHSLEPTVLHSDETGRLFCWDLQSRNILDSFRISNSPLYALHAHPHGMAFVIGLEAGTTTQGELHCERNSAAGSASDLSMPRASMSTGSDASHKPADSNASRLGNGPTLPKSNCAIEVWSRTTPY